MNATENVTDGAQGNPLTMKSQVLETGAAAGQVSKLLSSRRDLTH